jgi:glycosyltransferase involved in cell wall biosynthesis
MRILLINDSLIRGGKERRLIELVKGLLARNDVVVELIILSDRIQYPEIHQLDIPLHQLVRKPKKDPRVIFRIHDIAKRFQPDIIHSWSSMCTLFAMYAARRTGAKLVNACIADAPRGLKIWGSQLLRAKLTYPFSDRVLSNSKAGLVAYDAPKDKGRYIYNGFDFNRVNAIKPAEEIRERFHIKTPYVVGKIAAFHERKDYFTYIKAAVQVCQQRADVSFLSVGDGALMAQCQAMVPAELKDRILFLGRQNDVESIINVFTVGVLSTNLDVHGEGISNSIMEYMVMHKPVVATVGGGTAEIVFDGENGFLIPEKSAEIMTEKINYLLDHPEEAKRMGDNGWQLVFDQFNLRDMTSNYLALYEELLGS